MKSKLSPYSLNRRYFYAYGDNLIRKYEDGNPLYAYTKEEWGIGGRHRNGGNYTTRNVWFLLLITIVMIPAAAIGLFITLICLFNLKIGYFLFAAFFTLLFGGAVYMGFTTCRDEFKAQKLRWMIGIPKPGTAVDDNYAYKWFAERPERGIELTEQNFPDADTFRQNK